MPELLSLISGGLIGGFIGAFLGGFAKFFLGELATRPTYLAPSTTC